MKVGRVVFNPETFESEVTCGKAYHTYRQGSEICICGKKPKHVTHRCSCGDIHWMPRNSEIKVDEGRS